MPREQIFVATKLSSTGLDEAWASGRLPPLQPGDFPWDRVRSQATSYEILSKELKLLPAGSAELCALAQLLRLKNI